MHYRMYVILSLQWSGIAHDNDYRWSDWRLLTFTLFRILFISSSLCECFCSFITKIISLCITILKYLQLLRKLTALGPKQRLNLIENFEQITLLFLEKYSRERRKNEAFSNLKSYRTVIGIVFHLSLLSILADDRYISDWRCLLITIDEAGSRFTSFH